MKRRLYVDPRCMGWVEVVQDTCAWERSRRDVLDVYLRVRSFTTFSEAGIEPCLS